jgi:hypothetical protein
MSKLKKKLSGMGAECGRSSWLLKRRKPRLSTSFWSIVSSSSCAHAERSNRYVGAATGEY